jgi:hypothetical protein
MSSVINWQGDNLVQINNIFCIDTAIRKIKPTDKSFKLTDSLGLYLLIKPNGSKLWCMKYRIDGKAKKLAFGPYPDVSLFKARQLRDAARAKIREGAIL